MYDVDIHFKDTDEKITYAIESALSVIDSMKNLNLTKKEMEMQK